jgi:hypothetical protein
MHREPVELDIPEAGFAGLLRYSFWGNLIIRSMRGTVVESRLIHELHLSAHNGHCRSSRRIPWTGGSRFLLYGNVIARRSWSWDFTEVICRPRRCLAMPVNVERTECSRQPVTWANSPNDAPTGLLRRARLFASFDPSRGGAFFETLKISGTFLASDGSARARLVLAFVISFAGPAHPTTASPAGTAWPTGRPGDRLHSSPAVQGNNRSIRG